MSDEENARDSRPELPPPPLAKALPWSLVDAAWLGDADNDNDEGDAA